MLNIRRIFTLISTVAVVAANAQIIAIQADHPRQAAVKQDSLQSIMSAGNIVLSDILGSQKPISIFASFTRDVESVATRLESQTANTTLLAPLNGAISSLPRKPWEDPREYAQLGANAYHGNDGSERAEKNLRRFVEAHVVPASPWEEGSKVKTLAGGEVWWENQDGKTMIMPGKIEVERVAKQVGNGEVWILEKVINYA